MTKIQNHETTTSTGGTLRLTRTDPRPAEFDRFEELTRKLVQVPKDEIAKGSSKKRAR
jgi:hypothetical protein